MLEKGAIEAVKDGVDLAAVIRSRGIELKRNGKGLIGRCPFHADENPSLSVSPREKLWKCFGCGAGGDVIRFIELFDKVGFREAVEKLAASLPASGPASGGARRRAGKAPSGRSSGNGQGAEKTERPLSATSSPGTPEVHPAAATSGGSSAIPSGTPDPAEGQVASATSLSVRQIKLLLRVIEFYHTAFIEDDRARKYLASRGITDNALLSAYKIGFANGTLLNVLSADGDITAELKQIGVLNNRGGEHFHGCVTFPLYDTNGNPVGMYGRRIDGMRAEGPPHLYLPGPRRGLFNRQAAKTHRELILTEAVLDSVTLIQAGTHHTIPCYGVNGLTAEHLDHFRQCGVTTLYLAFDGDEAGKKAMATLGARLTAEGFRVYPVTLPPGEDVTSLFSLTADRSVARERFLHLLDQASLEASPATDRASLEASLEARAQARTQEETAVREKTGEARGARDAAAATAVTAATAARDTTTAGSPADAPAASVTAPGTTVDAATRTAGAVAGEAARGEARVAVAAGASVEAAAPGPAPAGHGFTTTDYGFTAAIGPRRYEVRGIGRADSRLKATVKGIGDDAGRKRFHVDTVDFYSARSRAFLTKGLADLFGEPVELIGRDLERLMEWAEAWREVEPSGPTPLPEMSPADRDKALQFLKNPRLFEEVLADFETLGYTGEEMNKLLCYLAAVSRKIEEPLSVMIQSRSAAGKSFLQDTVLSLIPEEDFVKYTRLTDQALFYKDSASIKHKVLAVEELDGMNGAIYSIRSIQSSKKITIAYTGKDPVTGRLRTEENTVEGPLSVFITTTSVDIDGETASRFVFLSIDESREMTEKILAKQRESYTREGMLKKLEAAHVVAKHQNANRLLRPLAVINPYAGLLTFTSRSLRARRDHIKYQNLILAVSFLFQYQRKTIVIEHGGKSVECVLVALDDIARANEIAGVILGRSLDELSPPSRKLLMLIREMSEKNVREDNVTLREYRFNRRQVREFSGWSDFQVRTHIAQLEDLEYLYATTGRRGKEYVYELVYTGGGEDGQPFLIGLIDIGELRKKAEEAGIGDQ